MASTNHATPPTHEEIIAQYVAGMREEFDKAAAELEGGHDEHSAAPESSGQQRRLVAMWDGRTPLVAADFFEVDCRELNSEGVSFWMEYPPSTPFIVVQIEMNGEVVFLKSRILHANPDLTVDNARYLVAARLNGRVNPGFQPPSVTQ